MTIHDLALNLIEHSDVFPVPEISEETAAEYISWLDPDTNLPEDLTPEAFAEVWNSIVREGVDPDA